MPDEAAVADPIPTDKIKRQRPKKPLPTDRIAFQKQMDILRAYAVAYETSGGKAVSSTEVANIVKMAASTVPHANSFFGDPDIALLQKVEGGYIPGEAVIAFNRAYRWNADTAAHKLAPAFQGTWFAQALMPRLSFRSMDERDAIGVLADASSATPEYEGQLALALAFLEVAGMIEREGEQVRARPSAEQPIRESPAATELAPQQPTRGIESSFARPANSGGVHFHVSIDIDTAEMSSWTPERIAAFFAGFAQVLAAKGALEKNAAKE